MYLWIDLWDKKVWIAIEINWIVIPKEIVKRTLIIKKLKIYIKKYEIKIIIVWLPYDLYNEDDRQLKKTRKFIKKLKIIFPNQKIVWIDERFTTIESENILNKIKFKWEKDDISASLILETYISRRYWKTNLNKK